MLLILFSRRTCQSIRDFESFFSALVGETRQIVVFENENLNSEFELVVGMIGWGRGSKIYGCLGLFHLRTKVSSRKTVSVFDFDPITPFWGFDWWLVTCSLVQNRVPTTCKEADFWLPNEKAPSSFLTHFWPISWSRSFDGFSFCFTKSCFGLLRGPIRLKIHSRKIYKETKAKLE